MKTKLLAQIPIKMPVYIEKILVEKSEKRRLLDLGMIKGAKITPIFAAPGGDPIAYEIKGTVIALRKTLASKILVKVAWK